MHTRSIGVIFDDLEDFERRDARGQIFPVDLRTCVRAVSPNVVFLGDQPRSSELSDFLEPIHMRHDV